MPKKPKPTAPITTITLTVSDGVFGGFATASAPGAEGKYVRYSIQAATGGQAGDVPIDSTGHAQLGCGPTPSWSSGGGSGTAEVIEYTDPQDLSQFAILSAPATFTVLP